uniref:Uncharacterized protein n=1 Tax=Anguilla anguilla TaxID=7936 RepID=A0A0E9T5N7_ANGAN
MTLQQKHCTVLPNVNCPGLT